MKEVIRQFVHEVFESELIDKLEALSINNDYVDIQPATREVARELRKLVGVRGLEMSRYDFHTFRVKEHVPTVQLELTEKEVLDLYMLIHNTMDTGLKDKICDLFNNFSNYAE